LHSAGLAIKKPVRGNFYPEPAEPPVERQPITFLTVVMAKVNKKIAGSNFE
jgi:hypothetical protein